MAADTRATRKGDPKKRNWDRLVTSCKGIAKEPGANEWVWLRSALITKSQLSVTGRRSLQRERAKHW
jgi:hypothetical protein